jgi:F-BAR domain only protein
VIKGRRQSTHPYGQNLSPERKRSSSNITSKIGNFGKKSKEGSTSLSPQPTGESHGAESAAPTSRRSDSVPSPILERVSSDIPNGKTPDHSRGSEAGPSLVNGNVSSSSPMLEDSTIGPNSPPDAVEVSRLIERSCPSCLYCTRSLRILNRNPCCMVLML